MTLERRGASPGKIRALIADDSVVMRSLLRGILDSQPRVEVVGVARNGNEAIAAFDQLRPDLVLLDIEMPEMDGLETLTAIRKRSRSVAVIMCSTLTRRGAGITIEALAHGATDYVSKPEGNSGVSQGIDALTRELKPKLQAIFPEEAPIPAVAGFTAQPPISPLSAAAPQLAVIGVSTGGPAALEILLPGLSDDFPVPVLIVQHMPRVFTEQLAQRLNGFCRLRVREAVEGNLAQPGVVEIARGDWHLEITRDRRLHLDQKEQVNFCRPSVDVLFRSAVAAFGGRVLGVVLTGMGSDGLAGCRAICAAGGCVLAQDSATSVVWGMPGAVAGAGLANKVMPLNAIAGEMVRLVSISRRTGAQDTEATAK